MRAWSCSWIQTKLVYDGSHYDVSGRPYSVPLFWLVGSLNLKNRISRDCIFVIKLPILLSCVHVFSLCLIDDADKKVFIVYQSLRYRDFIVKYFRMIAVAGAAWSFRLPKTHVFFTTWTFQLTNVFFWIRVWPCVSLPRTFSVVLSVLCVILTSTCLTDFVIHLVSLFTNVKFTYFAR